MTLFRCGTHLLSRPQQGFGNRRQQRRLPNALIVVGMEIPLQEGAELNGPLVLLSGGHLEDRRPAVAAASLPDCRLC